MLELNVHKNAPTIWVPYSSLAEMQCNLLDKTFEQGAMNFTILPQLNAFYNRKDGWTSLNIIRKKNSKV